MLGSGDRFGGMLSFTLRGGEPARAAFVNALELAAIAVSLGDCSTLVWPWATSDLIRLSVGVEDEADLIADFRRALDAAARVVAA
jgi:cystathionine gamma-synthase